MWGRMASCAPVGNRRYAVCLYSTKRVNNPLQVANLPHKALTTPLVSKKIVTISRPPALLYCERTE